jgi:hypothetical protein
VAQSLVDLPGRENRLSTNEHDCTYPLKHPAMRRVVPCRSVPAQASWTDERLSEVPRKIIEAFGRSITGTKAVCAFGLAEIVCCQLDVSRSDALRLERGCQLLPRQEVRGSGELSLRLKAGDSFAQRRQGALQRL